MQIKTVCSSWSFSCWYYPLPNWTSYLSVTEPLSFLVSEKVNLYPPVHIWQRIQTFKEALMASSYIHQKQFVLHFDVQVQFAHG